MRSLSTVSSAPRAAVAAAAVAVSAAALLGVALVVPASAKPPQDKLVLVRGNSCGGDGWRPFTTAGYADNISVWCFSRASIKRLNNQYYQNISEASVCELRCAVRRKYLNGAVPNDPWPSTWGCAAFVSDVKRLDGTAVYAAGSRDDESGTGNHCHLSGPTQPELMDTFSSHYDCSGYVCQVFQ